MSPKFSANYLPHGAQENSDLLMPAVGTYLRHYELIRELGGGGMGQVFLARDSKLARLVAIKFLHLEGEDLSQRFVGEARAIAKCSGHENIVTLYEADEYEGVPYLVLEYLAGNTLKKVLDSYPETKPMPPVRAVELLAPVVRAIICAHEHNIVHRDLKPDNIIITESGTIKVLDFGIAKVVQPDFLTIERVAPIFNSIPNDVSLENSNLTQKGSLIGTLTHMAPEQWETNENIDFRADLWACGIIMFRMLSGRHPLHHLHGMQLQVVSLLDQPMPSLRSLAPHVPEELARVVDWCLKKRLEERIPNAKALLQALEPLLPGHLANFQSDQCPYSGLYAFQEDDHNKFYGRSLEVEALLIRLSNQPLVIVVGPSGVGKSSFVRAGLIPALKRADYWESIVFRPGSNPLLALARCMGEPESEVLEKEIVNKMRTEPGWAGAILRNKAKFGKKRLLVFIDQFEELYTLTKEVREREYFLSCLGGIADHASSPIRVIISVRSDFVDRIFQEQHSSKEWEQGLFFLRSPQGKGLEDALVKPLEMAGYSFENDTIINEMLEYLRNTPGALPLLQFVAMQLWEGRDRNRKLVTMQSYQELGGYFRSISTICR